MKPEIETSALGLSRRNFLGVGSAALATATFAAVAAHAQELENTRKAESDGSFSDPAQENQPLLDENPSSNMPPATDHGDVGPIWYSFDLAHKRVQEGGWTHQVTQRELPSSTGLAGVNMRLTAGAFRELHWHTADEWAIMLSGNARVTVMNPDGTMFIDDISKGDLWYFPAGFPHSIQGLRPDGCEFLLVFDEGAFSEDNTFLISEWVAHTPRSILTKNFGLGRDELAKLPKEQLYIFPASLPQSLAADRASIGGRRVESPFQYTFHMESMPPTKRTAGGEARIVDSTNFPVSRNIAAGLVTIHPGGMRELHWAFKCLRVAVLPRGESANDRFHAWWSGTHHGFQRQRRRLCPRYGWALYREQRQNRSGLPRDVSGKTVHGLFSQQLDPTAAVGSSDGAPESE